MQSMQSCRTCEVLRELHLHTAALPRRALRRRRLCAVPHSSHCTPPKQIRCGRAFSSFTDRPRLPAFHRAVTAPPRRGRLAPGGGGGGGGAQLAPCI